MKKLNVLLIAIFSLIVSSCASTNSSHDVASNDKVVEQAPKLPRNYKGHYKVGNPYTINGVTYTPKEYKSYKKTGLASWYGEYYQGKKTANGEIYNMNDLTAAHNTLPLPSIVRVKNLNNGRSIIVRVNDRGPFVKGRIIDLSKEAAQILGFTRKGLTKVEVELLKKETKELQRSLGLNQ